MLELSIENQANAEQYNLSYNVLELEKLEEQVPMIERFLEEMNYLT